MHFSSGETLTVQFFTDDRISLSKISYQVQKYYSIRMLLVKKTNAVILDLTVDSFYFFYVKEKQMKNKGSIEIQRTTWLSKKFLHHNRKTTQQASCSAILDTNEGT